MKGPKVRRLTIKDPKPKPKIQNPEPRTQNPEPRTQNPEPKTQNPKPKHLQTMKLTDAWDELSGGPNEDPSTRIHVTINRYGTIGFNRKTYDLLGRPEALALWFNKTRGRIAVTATHRRNDKGFPVKPQATNFFRIQASPF